MEFFEKVNCLLMFKTLLDLFITYFIVSEPIYENIQPSQSNEKTVFKLLFHDEMLNLIPHSKNGIMYDFRSINKTILFTIIGRYWTQSKYKFLNEADYITTMESISFQTEPSQL